MRADLILIFFVASLALIFYGVAWVRDQSVVVDFVVAPPASSPMIEPGAPPTEHELAAAQFFAFDVVRRDSLTVEVSAKNRSPRTFLIAEFRLHVLGPHDPIASCDFFFLEFAAGSQRAIRVIFPEGLPSACSFEVRVGDLYSPDP